MPIFKTICFIYLTFLTALPALAQCGGVDLRAGLVQSERSDIAARLAELPFTQGNHWRATSGAKTIHLIGTIHIDDPRLDPITERLRGVVEASELLMLEATPKEEAALKREMTERPEVIFLQDQTLPELLTDAQWATLSAAMTARGIPPMIASRFQPWYLSVLLAMPPCLANALQEKPNGLDHRLLSIAEASGIATRALEPHDTLFELFDTDPLRDQLDVMMLGLSTEQRSEDMLRTLQEAYFDERHGEAWEMSRREVMRIEGETPERLEHLFSEMEADLLMTRNQSWMPVILKALEDHSVITVAAGAGHLHGPLGVLALLDLEGFALERLPF